MFAQSYRQYLDFLYPPKKRSSPLKKTVVTFIFLLLIVFGVFSSTAYFIKAQELPKARKTKYIEQTQRSFREVHDSLDEVLSGFKVAGAKTQVLESLNEASAEASTSARSYAISFEDLTKTLNILELAQKNIEKQIKVVREENTPSEFVNLSKDMLAYFSESQKTLQDFYNEDRFAKDVVQELGPDFYEPRLSNESMWKTAKKDDIKAYFEKTGKDAQVVIDNLSRLNTPSDFQDFSKSETLYLKLVVETSTQIVKTLGQEEPKDQDSASQTESAFQILTLAKKENEPLINKVAEDRVKLLSLKDNLERMAKARVMQTSLEGKISDLESQKEKTPLLDLFNFLGISLIN